MAINYKINKMKTLKEVIFLHITLLLLSSTVIAQSQPEPQLKTKANIQNIKLSSDCDSISDLNERLNCLTNHINNITKSFDTETESNESNASDDTMSLEKQISNYSTKINEELTKIKAEKLKKLELLTDIVLQKNEVRELYTAFDNQINIQISNAITTTEQALQREFADQEKIIYANNMKQFYYKMPEMLLDQIKKKMILSYNKNFSDEDIDYFISIYNNERFNKLKNHNISLFKEMVSSYNSENPQAQTKLIMDLALLINGVKESLLESTRKTRNELKSAGFDYKFLDALIIEYNKTSATDLAKKSLRTGNFELPGG